MKADNRFEDMDRAALHDALLALRTCPRCRGDLQPVALCEDVWGCRPCHETWYLPAQAARAALSAGAGEGGDK